MDTMIYSPHSRLVLQNAIKSREIFEEVGNDQGMERGLSTGRWANPVGFRPKTMG
jgi:hypothetical protein